MLIGAYSENHNIVTALIGMCSKCGSKTKKIRKYDKTEFIGCDIVIIDLDNCEVNIEELKKDIQERVEIVFVGISNNVQNLKDCSEFMNVESKPFNDKLFKRYKDLVFKRLGTPVVVPKTEERVYDEFGLNLAETFNNSKIDIENRVNLLSSVISKKSKYASETEFLNSIGLGDIEYQEKKRIPLPEINLEREIEKDAITKYRIRKLKNMNLSNMDVDNKIYELINANISVSTSKPKITKNEKDVLDALRKSGKANIGRGFQERKQAMEEAKQAENKKTITDIPIKSTEEKPVRIEKEEKIETKVVVEDVPARKPPQFEKPILNNRDNAPPRKNLGFKKPMIVLNEEAVEDTIEPVNKIDEKENKNIFKRPSLSLHGDSASTDVKVEKDSSSKEIDPLERLREQRRRESANKSSENGSSQDNKMNTFDSDDNTMLSDNKDVEFFGTSLLSKLESTRGVRKAPQQKENLFDIAHKKSKPPR